MEDIYEILAMYIVVFCLCIIILDYEMLLYVLNFNTGAPIAWAIFNGPSLTPLSTRVRSLTILSLRERFWSNYKDMLTIWELQSATC